MPMWPFGRRGGKAAKLKEGRATAVAERKRPVAAKAHEFASSDALRTSPSRRSSRRRRRRSRSTASMHDVEKSSPNLPPVDAPFAKEQGLPRPSVEDITALPLQKRLEQSPHLRPISQQQGIPYNFQADSQSSLPTARERGKLQRPQSLRKPATDSALVRRKSSKKQKREHEHIREEEIRAMSMPLPQKRPAGNSGGMLRRDSKKVKGALNHRFERPTSNISLPVEESIHSSMSGSSDPRAFRVSALDMFSPRPTIRCSVGTQWAYGGVDTSPSSNKSKNETQRGRRMTTSRDSKENNRTSRIDDLADTLDAGALREILERDKRRREKKRKAEEDRLRRRLERRAEKQKAMEVGGTPATPRRDASGVIGLGIEKETATPMEDVRPSTPQQPQRTDAAAVAPTTPKADEVSLLPTPLESPIEETAQQAIRYNRGSVSAPGHTRGPSNVSHLPELLSEKLAQQTPAVDAVAPVHDPNASGSLHPVETADTATTSKKSSNRRRSSEGRRMAIFASLFRRGKRRSQDQGRTPSSEVSFSNTSRESMSRQPLPAHLVAPTPTPPIPIKRPSSVPRRTMSKFREDLPEFPISPPDSRVQSPEITSGKGAASRRRSQPPSDLRVESNSPGAGRTDSPVSPGVPNAGLMSQSLASVDSEGSWLSGKPMQRRSNKSYLRSSVGSSSAVKRNEEFNASYEELGIPDDEYFKRLTPQPDERRRSVNSADLLARKASSTAMATLDAAAESDDDEPIPATERNSEDEELVQHTVGRQPTIVHRQARVKSTEGLLSFFQTDRSSAPEEAAIVADSAEGESPTSESEPMTVQRAKSIELGKNHVRHLSAGSAKLLEIQKRASTSSHSKFQQQD